MATSGIHASIGAGSAAARPDPAVVDLINQIQSDKEDVRAKAWQYAYVVGPQALKPLAAMVTGTPLEVGRAAKRSMWRIVRHAGRPGADEEKAQAVPKLLGLLGEEQSREVRAEAMWMLSEIAGDEAVGAVSALLSNEEMREDARMVLERLPGEQSLAALKAAIERAPEDFKINIAQSLRARGVSVDGLACRKLTPTKQTAVKPVGR